MININLTEEQYKIIKKALEHTHLDTKNYADETYECCFIKEAEALWAEADAYKAVADHLEAEKNADYFAVVRWCNEDIDNAADSEGAELDSSDIRIIRDMVSEQMVDVLCERGNEILVDAVHELEMDGVNR